MDDDTALPLELAGLWRRAATCWVAVMDQRADDMVRENIALRRLHCLSTTCAPTPEQRRYQNKKRYRAQKSRYVTEG
ncbi:PerC family transcriptional regulator [Serratia nevei]|uniref:PerC family transcriptional regulator n=1 Tax=Serratia nevei TaxID=2703794 RepID=UPI00313A8CE8